MNAKRIVLVSMALVLTGACAWGATGTSGFTPVAENEATQIVGGDGVGYVCDIENPITPPELVQCYNNGNDTGCLYGAWYWIMPRLECVWAGSGECYNVPLVQIEYGACTWKAETKECKYDGEVYFLYVDACA